MNKTTKYFILSATIVLVGVIYLVKIRLSKFKRQVIFQSNTEVDKWVEYNELSPQTANIVADYWNRGLGWSVTEEQVLDPSFQEDYAWSAAFISWVMKVSGAEDNFPYSPTHAYYVIETTNNRFNNEKAKFKAYSVDEVKPKPSDIVCRRRGNSNATYDNVSPYDTLHCDIVTDVYKDKIEAVGGNISNKVKKVDISLDSQGYINESGYFTIIKTDL